MARQARAYDAKRRPVTVVQSRWSLDLEEQFGALVEINTRSTAAGKFSEARPSGYGVGIGRQKQLQASTSVKVDDCSRQDRQSCLAGGGIFCVLLFLAVFYYYGWSGQRTFTSPIGQFIYFALPGLLAIAFFMSLRLRASHKINIALSFVSVALTTYTLEGAMTLWSSLPSVRVSQNRQSLMAAAQALGVKYDSRTKAQVIDDFRNARHRCRSFAIAWRTIDRAARRHPQVGCY